MKLCVVSFSLLLLLTQGSAWLRAESPPLEDLFEERLPSVVAVEFFVETEVDRRPSSELGVVADAEGLIVLQDHAIPGWLPPEQLKEFKVYPLRSRRDFAAEYLGQDVLTGWHFLRVSDEEFHDQTVPVTAFPVAEPRIGQEVWGFGVTDREFDYEPYFLSSRFSLLRDLPRKMGFTVSPVTSPGSLLFARDGGLIGWGSTSYLTEAVLHIADERIPVAWQRSRESGAYIPASEFLPHLGRVPAGPKERVVPWLGVTNLQPVEREVADFLGLADRGGVILSEIAEGSAAAKAGLQKGDVVVAVNKEPIPYYRPHHASTQHLQLEVLKRAPGETISLTVIRGTEELERDVEVDVQPTSLREARREYLRRIGLTAREFLLFDGMARQVGPETERGLIVQFVRPNSPADTAEVRAGDWIREIDGTEIGSYEEAVQLLADVEADEGRREVVLLVDRQNDTSVVRVRLR